MSDFRQRFMQAAEQAYNSNTTLIGRYKEDSSHVVENLCRELSELQYVEAHLDELSNKDRLRQFFDGLENRFNTGLSKYSREFTQEANETYLSYDKKLKGLFSEEGISGKDIYDHIERNSEGDYSLFAAKADNIRLQPSLLRDAQSEISKESDRAINKAKRKKMIWGICLPLLVIVLFVVFVIMQVIRLTRQINMAAASLGEAAGDVVSGLDLDNIALILIRYLDVRDATEDAAVNFSATLPLIAVGALVLAAIWLIYYKILARQVKEKMLRDLKNVAASVYTAFEERKFELQEGYAELLTAHLDEMNVKYFMKYKPLVELVQNQGGM